MRWFGNLLIAVGLAIVVAGGGLIGYSTWAQAEHAQQVGPGPSETVVATLPTPTEVPPTPLAPEPTPAPTRPEATPIPTATLVPTPAPTVVPDLGEPVWMRIPNGQVNYPIVPVGIVDDQYQADWWNIGHQDDSPDPGQPGNGVYNGHVHTINAGHVFEYLKNVSAGDAIYIYTRSYRTDWVVTSVTDEPNNATDFLEPTEDTRITLYTCDGTWLPLQGTFSDRLIVVAHLAGIQPDTSEAKAKPAS